MSAGHNVINIHFEILSSLYAKYANTIPAAKDLVNVSVLSRVRGGEIPGAIITNPIHPADKLPHMPEKVFK